MLSSFSSASSSRPSFSNQALARETLEERDRETILCRSCDSCSVFCTMRFDVAARMKEVGRILDTPVSS